MKRHFINFLVILICLLFLLAGCSGNSDPTPVVEQFWIDSGWWWSHLELLPPDNRPSGNAIYYWQFGVRSSIPCTLRIRAEYYNYDPGTLEATIYSDPVQMEPKVRPLIEGQFVTNSVNIKKIVLVLERIDKGIVQEVDSRQYDNIPKQFL